MTVEVVVLVVLAKGVAVMEQVDFFTILKIFRICLYMDLATMGACDGYVDDRGGGSKSRRRKVKAEEGQQ